jgi:uncharacterized protein
VILYLDTSALVKLYAREEGSAVVRAAVAGAQAIATSLLAYAEARAAFARKRRLGDISDPVLRRLKRDFERDWTTLHRMAVDEAIVRRAGELAEAHGLRGYDALHLASADLLQTTGAAPVIFGCFDSALGRAAAARGMRTL